MVRPQSSWIPSHFSNSSGSFAKETAQRLQTWWRAFYYSCPKALSLTSLSHFGEGVMTFASGRNYSRLVPTKKIQPMFHYSPSEHWADWPRCLTTGRDWQGPGMVTNTLILVLNFNKKQCRSIPITARSNRRGKALKKERNLLSHSVRCMHAVVWKVRGYRSWNFEKSLVFNLRYQEVCLQCRLYLKFWFQGIM